MPIAKTDDGLEIYYEVYGHQHNKTLVLVPGYFGIANLWDLMLEELKIQYRCIVYDSRGFGRSSKPEEASEYSIERHALDLQCVLAAAQADEPVVLITHSMGCNIATVYYFGSPDQVQGIVYLGPYRDGKQLQQFGYTINILAGSACRPSKSVNFYAKMGLQESIALESAKWPAYARRHNARAALECSIGERHVDIRIPTMVVMGEKDEGQNGTIIIESLKRDIADCKVEFLKGVDHFPPTEAPDQVAILVDAFVTSLGA